MPPDVATVVVPASVPPPGLVWIVMTTLIGLPMTGLPAASWTWTVIAGAIETPAVADVGCWTKTTLAGAPAPMSKAELSAAVSEAARGVQRVADAGLVDAEVAERRDAVDRGRGRGAAQDARVRVGADGDRDRARAVVADEVLVLVQELDGDGRRDRRIRRRARGLLDEADVRRGLGDGLDLGGSHEEVVRRDRCRRDRRRPGIRVGVLERGEPGSGPDEHGVRRERPAQRRAGQVDARCCRYRW